MSADSGKSDSSSEAVFNQDVWSGQSPALQNLYGNLEGLFKGTNQGMQGLIPGAVGNANEVSDATRGGQDYLLGGGAYTDSANADMLTNSLNQSFNNPSAMSEINAMIMGGEGNNYADAMKASYMEDANLASQNMLSNLDARAAASQMSGGGRHGVATAGGFDDINRNLQQNLAKTGFESFDKDLDRKLNIAGQADQNTLNRQQMLSNMISGQNQTVGSGVNAGQGVQQLGLGQFAPWMMPWEAASQYATGVGRPTITGSGTSSGDSESSSFGFGF